MEYCTIHQYSRTRNTGVLCTSSTTVRVTENGTGTTVLVATAYDLSSKLV